MDITTIKTSVNRLLSEVELVLNESTSYYQVLIIACIYAVSYGFAAYLKKHIGLVHDTPPQTAHPIRKLAYEIGNILAPLFAIICMTIIDRIAKDLGLPHWLLTLAVSLAILLFFYSFIRAFVLNPIAASLFKWLGLPILTLHLVGALPSVILALEQISIQVGNLSITAYGVARAIIFGGFLFWLGRASNKFGLAVIKKQATLDVPTKEVFSKLFEVAIFCIVVLLLLNVMGVNLTTLAVFGGAVGVGLGLGLQSIASNFISGIIILLDRSLTVGDYVELEDGKTGFVREFKMRYTVLETYDGKDVLVPNEKFISSSLINWTHKDPKQRYRVDFSVPYSTDVRPMVEFIKEAVANHPQVISGLDVPFEERPDCEIDSFGDSGINMFVEFWMLGVDDGKNRVGGDLLLTILETLKANGIEIPFPQREVRILQ